jgi:hypothetical protein
MIRRRMASDNIFDQVEALIASDDRQQLPESADRILQLISKLPGAGPLVWAARYESEKQKGENSELMLTVMWQELKRHIADFEEFRKEDPARREEIRRLVIDGMRKSEDLRDRKRVERIGKILAHAIAIGPASNFDKAEELMRIARDLSDQDVLALGHLYEHQFSVLNKAGWNIDVDEINKIWKKSQPKIPGTVLPGEVDSILLKLQGLGLAVAVERREFQLGPNERVFALLPKGADFVRYAIEINSTS